MLTNRIGFMQGRLSPLIDGKIQAFPVKHWRDEFPLAEKIGLGAMEWTLDDEGLDQNPFMTVAGRKEIRKFADQYHVGITSVTCDNFMQVPFHRLEGEAQKHQLEKIVKVCQACGELGGEYVVYPLVDNGRLANHSEYKVFIKHIVELVNEIERAGVKIIFEIDFPPKQVRDFILKLPRQQFGINYDTGNSAALGFRPEEEFEYYGEFIDNIHIKDRLLGGTTVPLGAGATDFKSIFEGLKLLKYNRRYILQTARAKDEQHSKVLSQYTSMLKSWIEKYGT